MQTVYEVPDRTAKLIQSEIEGGIKQNAFRYFRRMVEESREVVSSLKQDLNDVKQKLKSLGWWRFLYARKLSQEKDQLQEDLQSALSRLEKGEKNLSKFWDDVMFSFNPHSSQASHLVREWVEMKAEEIRQSRCNDRELLREIIGGEFGTHKAYGRVKDNFLGGRRTVRDRHRDYSRMIRKSSILKDGYALVAVRYTDRLGRGNRRFRNLYTFYLVDIDQYEVVAERGGGVEIAYYLQVKEDTPEKVRFRIGSDPRDYFTIEKP